jgi:hypothetical protein
MGLDPKVTIKLDREREIKWTTPCMARLGELKDPPTFSDLLSENAARSHYSLCAFLWACVEGREDFATPLVLAEFLETLDQVAAASTALFKALLLAGVLTPKKKTAADPTPSSRVSSESSGRTPSSNSGRRAPRSKN